MPRGIRARYAPHVKMPVLPVPVRLRPPLWALATALLTLGAAQARPVAIGGSVQAASVGTRLLGGAEMLPVWSLPRLGVEVRNDPQDLRLKWGARELRYAPERGWRALGLSLNGSLPAPQLQGQSLYAPLAALRLLGVPLEADTPGLLAFSAPLRVPGETLPPSPDLPPVLSSPTAPSPVVPTTFSADAVTTAPPPTQTTLGPVPVFGNQLQTVRVNRELHRQVETQRVVLELSAPVVHEVQRITDGLAVRLPGVGLTPGEQALPSGDRLTLEQDAGGGWVRLHTGEGRSEVFTLADPPRIVIDTVTQLSREVPPPLDPQALPAGVTYRQLGGLHLLSFDPARFQARVVSAPRGSFAEVAQLVTQTGGVAGVNASYFDLASALPVDLVVSGGLMTAASLEKRATVGLLPGGGLIFGYPRPRYRVRGAFGEVQANAVTSRARPEWLTAFVGDGQTLVGAAGLLTLHVQLGAGTVTRAVSGPHVPPAGTLTLTFDPARFAQLPRQAGEPLDVGLDWRTDDAPWPQTRDALSAGPLLVQAGRPVTDPRREGFDTGASIWRPTRQVALGLWRGQPTIAYLEHGTPEAFAAALVQAGLSDALRLDSGSSATAYSTSGYGDLGGYLNTVWSRPVPNAIVFVPKVTGAAR
ncbi:phosphodiester glycosidase family protein [Deinococcus radiodurans]|nr:hypothetical protein DXG80_00345 [Deinococcus radiodurans]QIP28976.1 phosphodiester glycosidase family protein [Deinococcus radiodurans]QIP32315.1 phosphodiester glycosidase family protein [Deinococcus radiodurans]UDL01671.1 hypothetical protein E5E91_04435 [Deinococcus radiodurans R1 = ATCC 13939 = DSM 20539]UID69851.1 hypothetical protein DRO_0851 [Deinococcus radiodurans R1 = ATCC 13939 = DSM 20539]